MIPNDALCFEKNEKPKIQFFLIFSLWDVVDFVLNICSTLGTWTNSEKKMYVRGLHPPGSGYFWIESR